MKEKIKKYTLAVDSNKTTLFYNGYFVANDEDMFSSDRFFKFYDEKEADSIWINKNKIIWIKEIKNVKM